MRRQATLTKLCDSCSRLNPFDAMRCISCGRSMWKEPVVDLCPPWLRDFLTEYEESFREMIRKDGDD